MVDRPPLLMLCCSRVLAGLLRQRGEWQRMRVMLCDLLMLVHSGHASIALGFAAIWPAAFYTLQPSGGECVLLQCLLCVTVFILCICVFRTS